MTAALVFTLIVLLVATGITELAVRRRLPLRVLLFGAGPFAAKVAEEIEARPLLGCRIVGVVEETGVVLPESLARYPLLGTPAELARIVEEVRPHRILIGLNDSRGLLPAMDLLGHQLRGVIVEEAVEVYERLSGKLAIETLRAGSQLFRDQFRASAFQDWVGRAVSCVTAAIGVVAFAPAFLLIAVLIKIDSRGPVLFRQQRVGLGGRPFLLLKFRTMRAADATTGTEWAADNHSRITRVGGLLRRLRLDELPQFFNLLKGEMNLVGPRPHPVSNFNLFNAQIPFYSLRCLVRPGLTGWAQTRYQYANNLAEETEKMRYDLYYIKHRSAWLDLQIIPATLRAVLIGKGATAQTVAPGSLALRAVALAIPAVTLAIPAAVLALPALGEKVLGQIEWLPGAGVNRWRGGALIPVSLGRRS